MIKPTVHINGTSREELERQVRKVHEAIEKAQEALRGMTPHGRDYPQGSDAINQALREHAARQAQLSRISDDLVEIWESLQEGKK